MKIWHSFLNELVSYLVILPAALLCFFPMKTQLRYSRKRTFLFSAAFLVLLLPSAAWVDAVLNLDYQALFLPLLALLFFLYRVALKASFSKSICVYLAICALFSFLSNFANGFDAVLHPFSNINAFSIDAALFQLGLGVFVAAVLAYPLSRYGSVLVERLNLPVVWYLASLISLLFLVFNILFVPRFYQTLYAGAIFRTFWVSLSLVFVLFLLLFVLFYYVVSGIISTSELDARNRFLEMQESQYQAQQNYIENTMRERHDFFHALRTIETLVQSQDFDGVRAFVAEYVDAMPRNAIQRYCRSSAVNALLNYYRESAQKYGIRLQWEIQIPEQYDIGDVDLCIILGNYLDNAITACQVLPEEQRWIRMSVLSRHAYYLYIVTSNSFSGHVRFRNGRYFSTRRNGTGLGLSSIQASVERYGGTARFSHHGNVFYMDIMLPLQREIPDSVL